MCDITTIASLIAAASIAVIAAVVLYGIAIVNAGSFWGAFANTALMIAAAVLLGTALASLGAANAALSGCAAPGACAGPTAVLQDALIAATTGLTILLAATIVGTVGTSIPWAGVAVALALLVGGIACGVGLVIVSVSIDSLDTCVRGAAAAAAAAPATTSVAIARVTAAVAGFATGLIGFVAIASTIFP